MADLQVVASIVGQDLLSGPANSAAASLSRLQGPPRAPGAPSADGPADDARG